MEKFASENLILVEFLVDRVNFEFNVIKDMEMVGGETCVSFQFLDNAPILVCEEDFMPQTRPASGGNVKNGKSCLFSLTAEQGEEALKQFDVYVEVFKKTQSEYSEKIILGESLISIVNMFNELMTAVSSGETTGARTLKDCFKLNSRVGDLVGHISLYIRMSCYGKLIVTQFQMNLDDKSVEFKAREGHYLFKCNKKVMGPPTCGPACGNIVKDDNQPPSPSPLMSCLPCDSPPPPPPPCQLPPPCHPPPVKLLGCALPCPPPPCFPQPVGCRPPQYPPSCSLSPPQPCFPPPCSQECPPACPSSSCCQPCSPPSCQPCPSPLCNQPFPPAPYYQPCPLAPCCQPGPPSPCQPCPPPPCQPCPPLPYNQPCSPLPCNLNPIFYSPPCYPPGCPPSCTPRNNEQLSMSQNTSPCPCSDAYDEIETQMGDSGALTLRLQDEPNGQDGKTLCCCPPPCPPPLCPICCPPSPPYPPPQCPICCPPSPPYPPPQCPICCPPPPPCSNPLPFCPICCNTQPPCCYSCQPLPQCCKQSQSLVMRPGCPDFDTAPFTFKLGGCCQGSNNISVSPPTCTAKDGTKFTEISDPNKEMFVLRVGKKSEGYGKKNNVDLEFCTPRPVPTRPIPVLDTKRMQYDEGDIPTSYLETFYGKDEWNRMRGGKGDQGSKEDKEGVDRNKAKKKTPKKGKK